MNKLPQLIIVTLMLPQGTTGVQTHFNEILKVAAGHGYQIRTVHPFDFNRAIRKIVGLITRLLRLTNNELVDLWVRFAHFYFLKHQLKGVLSACSGKVVLYAQDPLSARAALAARTNPNSQRVATVIHFNISEADECLLKGITQKNGRLYASLNNNERASLPRVDKLFYVSHFMRNIIHERLPATRAIPFAVIPNFIEDRAGIARSSSVGGDIISVGTLEPRKNQAFLLKVLARCKALGHMYRLTVVGDGPDRSTLENMACDLGLREQVTFLGFKPNAENFMASHRIFAHSAIVETMGIALVEALSHSLPIIAAPVGGIPEVFADGQEGFYWQLDDVAGAADRLCELLENKSLHAEMSKNARIRFVQNFSKQTLADKWLDELMSS